jgi:hypothetical protein
MNTSRALLMMIKGHTSNRKKKMTYLAILLIGLFLCIGMNSYAQDYIPENSSSIETARVILEYSFKPGANRPWAKFRFKDGFEINLNAVCEGDYAWCIRVYEDDRIIDLGSLKIEFYDNQNLIIVKTRINNNEKYERYLDLLQGKYKKVK